MTLWRRPVKGDNIRHRSSSNVVTVQCDWGEDWFKTNETYWEFVKVTPIKAPPPPPPPMTGWVNVYFRKLGTRAAWFATVYPTKEKADAGATEDRSACVFVTEGQFHVPETKE